MKKNILTIIYIIATIAMLSSCQKNELNPTNQHGLTLMIQNPVAERFKATEACNSNEASIQSLYLFFFDEQGKQVYSHTMQQYEANQKLLVIINQEQKELFKGQVKHTIYAVANITPTTYTAIKNKNLTEFKKCVISEPFINESERRFVMVASVSPSQNLQLGGYNNIGTFQLKHLLAKVRLTLDSNIEIDGFSCVDKKIQLINTTDRTYLDSEQIPSDISYSIQEGTLNNNQVVFYTYPNKWDSGSMDKRTHIALKLKLKNNQSNDEGNFYFYDASIDNQQMAIKTNHLYDIHITVNKLGSVIEDAPLDLTGNISIHEWSNNNILTEIIDSHYLSVDDTKVNMGYEELFLINYQTSDPIKITDVKSSFTFVRNTTGQEVTEATQGDQIATVTLVNGKIQIKSKRPVNYNPKDISFTVQHIDQSTGIDPIRITVKQYPSIYIQNTEGKKSLFRDDFSRPSDYDLNNRAIYSITCMMPSLNEFGDDFKNFVLGYPQTEQMDFFYYIYPRIEYGLTYSFRDNVTIATEEVANMISPAFELASQLGATEDLAYEIKNNYYDINICATIDYSNGYRYNRNAIANCAGYWEERIINGQIERLVDWRLPTKAEIKLIDYLQQQNTAINRILGARYYWSNLKESAIKIDYYNVNGYATSTQAHVRCVRDIK